MPVTLSEAIDAAASYWEAKGASSRMMPIRARACASALKGQHRLDRLGPTEATKVLGHLHRTKGKGSVPAYYAAFRRAVELAGGDTRGWPKAGAAPRKCREPLSEADVDRLAGALLAGPGAGRTFDLLELLRGTGLRIEREALNGEALRWDPGRKLLHITGKGGHQRVIPVERPETVELLGDAERMAAMRKLSYGGHLKRWNLALNRLRIGSLKPTPHAVRHYYATKVYHASGKDLMLVKELLGHADVTTTAGYLGVDVEAGREFVR